MVNPDITSQFYRAILDDNESVLTHAINHIRPQLVFYLQATMNAKLVDAEDAVQNVFMYTVNQIREGNIQSSDSLTYYLLRASRNHYLSIIRRVELESLDEEVGYTSSLEEQIDNLVDKEKKLALKKCVELLNKDSKHFIETWFHEPEMKAEHFAQKFNMTLSNVFTKKHRLIKKLAKCVKGKMDE